MDLQLRDTAGNFIIFVTEAIKDWGSSDVTRDPIYCLFGYPSQTFVDGKIAEYIDEINAVISFASEWDIDPTEWDFSDDWKKFIFAVSYIAMDFEPEALPEGETLEEYCDNIIEWCQAA